MRRLRFESRHQAAWTVELGHPFVGNTPGLIGGGKPGPKRQKACRGHGRVPAASLEIKVMVEAGVLIPHQLVHGLRALARSFRSAVAQAEALCHVGHIDLAPAALIAREFVNVVEVEIVR